MEKIRQITELDLHIKGTEYHATGANEKACIDAIAKEHSTIYKKKYFENLAKINGVDAVTVTYYFADSIAKHFSGSTKEEAANIAKAFFFNMPEESELYGMRSTEDDSTID